MPQQVLSSVENNFTAGLKTEFTGLNFPENAATDTDNCIYTLTGEVKRRLGIDYELNYTSTAITKTGKAISSYRWTNAGGNGASEVLVLQVGSTLHFYLSSAATTSSPVSAHLLASTINLATYQSGTFDTTIECQYTDGNGKLFVYHPTMNPIYVEFNPNTNVITATAITLQTRDFVGVPDGLDVNTRPSSLSNEHKYNLQNQGWTAGSAWGAYSGSSVTIATGNGAFDISVGGLPINNGDVVQLYANDPNNTLNPTLGARYVMTGTVVSYVGTVVTINISYIDPGVINLISYVPSLSPWALWRLQPVNSGFINSWVSAIGNYPSNADVWWRFKNTAGAYDPAGTYANISANTGYAPKGHYILDEFNQDRTGISGATGITVVDTNVRPRTGTWFQGRVWYAGVDDTQFASGDVSTYSWTENIYFSQVVTSNDQFGFCYQVNDPTSETLFDLLPTDGGVISIQGCGPVYKLFPIQNGMLVFAANGIWFITGSQGIGFTANDYTITKISSIRTQSSTSFVNVQGLPYFWNEEGIYTVTPAQQGLGLQVTPLTLETILSYYNDIPKTSKLYVKGDYNPIDYTIQWLFKSVDETDVTSRYQYDKIMVYNTANKAFYPYSIAGSPTISSINYLPGTTLITSPEPTFKYICSNHTTDDYFTLAEEYDDSYLDWKSVDSAGTNYDSYFVTGYKLHGQGQRRFQLGYIYVYSNADVATQYKIQGIWDYANDPNSGKYTAIQLVTNALTRFGKIFRRHKIRGRGLVLQFKVSSATGMPFHINGWSVQEQQNTGV
jgi:hypothetical protein